MLMLASYVNQPLGWATNSCLDPSWLEIKLKQNKTKQKQKINNEKRKSPSQLKLASILTRKHLAYDSCKIVIKLSGSSKSPHDLYKVRKLRDFSILSPS